MLVVTRAELDKLSKYWIEVHPLTGTETSAFVAEDRYDGERKYARTPFKWLIRSLLRCQDEMSVDEQDILLSLGSFFTVPSNESRWLRTEDEYDSYIEVDTQTLCAALRRARAACHPVVGQPDGGGVLDEAHDVLVLELATLDELIALVSDVPASKRTLLALTWGA